MMNMQQASRVNARKQKKQKKKKNKWVKVILSLLAVLFISAGAYLFNLYAHAKDTVDNKMNVDLDSIDKSVTQGKLSEKEVLNILLLGVDERSNDGGRSDAIMVLSIDPLNKQTTIISIPRDTRALIVGKGEEDKINHAYAFGGPDMSVATVENLLDIELDYYVELNMEGLSGLVDAIGGITVNNEIEWYDEGYYKKGYHYELGEIKLDGEQALGYSRMRKLDPRGDFGRTERQRKVIKAIIDKGASVASVTKIDDIIDVLGENLTTNMNFTDMQALLVNYKDAAKNIDNYMLQGENTMINGVFFYQISDEEIVNVHNMISNEKTESN